MGREEDDHYHHEGKVRQTNYSEQGSPHKSNDDACNEWNYSKDDAGEFFADAVWYNLEVVSNERRQLLNINLFEIGDLLLEELFYVNAPKVHGDPLGQVLPKGKVQVPEDPRDRCNDCDNRANGLHLGKHLFWSILWVKLISDFSDEDTHAGEDGTSNDSTNRTH